MLLILVSDFFTSHALDYKYLEAGLHKAEQLDSLNYWKVLPASTITFQIIV